MSYLLSKKPTDDFTRKLDNLVNTIKSNKQFRKGYDIMEAVWYTDAKYEGIAIGKQQGILQKAIETARNLLTTGLSLEQIANAVSLPIDEVKKIAAEANIKNL